MSRVGFAKFCWPGGGQGQEPAALDLYAPALRDNACLRRLGGARATVYQHRVTGNAANEARPPRRHGPEGACSDCALLEHVQAILEAPVGSAAHEG